MLTQTRGRRWPGSRPHSHACPGRWRHWCPQSLAESPCGEGRGEPGQMLRLPPHQGLPLAQLPAAGRPESQSQATERGRGGWVVALEGPHVENNCGREEWEIWKVKNEKIQVYVQTLGDLGSNPLHRWFSNGVIFFLPGDICRRPQTFCLSRLGGWVEVPPGG